MQQKLKSGPHKFQVDWIAENGTSGNFQLEGETDKEISIEEVKGIAVKEAMGDIYIEDGVRREQDIKVRIRKIKGD